MFDVAKIRDKPNSRADVDCTQRKEYTQMKCELCASFTLSLPIVHLPYQNSSEAETRVLV